MKATSLTILDLLDRLDTSRTLQPALRIMQCEDEISKELRQKLQDLESYIEEQTKINIDDDVAGHKFGWVSCAKNILQRIRGEK